MIIQIDPEIIKFDKKVQSLCKNKTDSFPKGCPNYGKKQGCPPNQPLINKVLDLSKPIYIIYTEFDIGSFAKRMWKNHPDWSEKQAYCCRYWQPRARKVQRIEESKALEKYNLTKIMNSPEAHGVNLTELMKKIGVILEWPPRKITRLVSLGGFYKY